MEGSGESSAVTLAIDSGYTTEEHTRIITLFRDWTGDPAGHGRLLITCRPRESGLPGVRRMELAGLARPDSLYLLAQVLRKHDTSLDDTRFDKDNLGALRHMLGDHPLSIELVGPHLKQLTPEQIVADFRKLLDQFTGDAEVRAQPLAPGLAALFDQPAECPGQGWSAVARPVPGRRV